MTKEKLIDGLNKIKAWAEVAGDVDFWETANNTIRLLEQQSSEDCISRDEAIRIAEQGQIQGYEWQFKKLCTLPSVTPPPKIGYWIRTRTWEHDGELYCSKCGFAPHDERDCDNFCPNCGAKMEVEDKESEE